MGLACEIGPSILDRPFVFNVVELYPNTSTTDEDDVDRNTGRLARSKFQTRQNTARIGHMVLDLIVNSKADLNTSLNTIS